MKNVSSTGQRQAFTFLIGNDGGLLRQEFSSRLARTPASGGSWQTHVFWGDEPPDQRFWSLLSQGGLFGESRAILIRNAQDWNATIWHELSSALANVPQFVWPFICLEVEMEKGKFRIPVHAAKSGCLKYAEKQGWVWRMQALQGPALQKHVKNKADSLGLTFAGKALSMFCDTVMPDAQAIANELEKLALLSENGQIGEDMIASGPANPEMNAFACIRKLENGDLSAVWREVATANASELLFFLIALLAREFRTLWQVIHGPEPWLHPREAEFKRGLARKMGGTGLAAGFCALADAEWQVKSGNRTPEQVLDFLVVEISRIFSSPGA